MKHRRPYPRLIQPSRSAIASSVTTCCLYPTNFTHESACTNVRVYVAITERRVKPDTLIENKRTCYAALNPKTYWNKNPKKRREPPFQLKVLENSASIILSLPVALSLSLPATAQPLSVLHSPPLQRRPPRRRSLAGPTTTPAAAAGDPSPAGTGPS